MTVTYHLTSEKTTYMKKYWKQVLVWCNEKGTLIAVGRMLANSTSVGKTGGIII